MPGHFGDLIQENGAPVSQFKTPLLVAHGAGKRPLDVPEQLAFEEPLGERAAIDRDEGPSAAAALAVDSGRHQLLAGAGLTGKVHRKVVAREFPDLLKEVEHLVIPADDPGKAGDFSQPRLQADDLGQVAKGAQHADKAPLLVGHPGDRHFNPARFTITGHDVQGVSDICEGFRRFAAEGAAIAAERAAKDLVAVLAQDFSPFVAGDLLSGAVEKHNAPVLVVSDDAFQQVIENLFQIPLVRQQAFQLEIGHRLALPRENPFRPPL